MLAGGSTPRPIYARLVELDTPWNQWHIYFGDERCLPIGHPERNDTMVREIWLDKVSIPVNQIHAVPAQLGPTAGAKRYAHELIGLGPFDLTLLGLGEEKRATLTQLRDGADMPIRSVNPANGSDLFIDSYAAPTDLV